MNETIYRKIGRRYVEVGPEFTGWPADGVWLVSDDRRAAHFVTKIGEVPCIFDFAKMHVGLDELTGVIQAQRSKSDNSSYDIARAVLKWMATKGDK